MSVEDLKEKARHHERREQWEKALELYREALEKSRDDEGQPDVSLFNRVGDLQVRVGDHHAALESYQEAIDLYLEAELPNNAIAICRKLIRNFPQKPEPFLRMGQIRGGQGFLTDARQNFLTYAEMVQAQGEMEEAFRALVEFVELAPDDVAMRLTLAEQLATHERTDEAVEQLQAAYRQQLQDGDDEGASATEARLRELDPTATVPDAEEAPAAQTSASSSGETTGLEGLEHTAFEDVGLDSAEEEEEEEEEEGEVEVAFELGDIQISGEDEEDAEDEEDEEGEGVEEAEEEDEEDEDEDVGDPLPMMDLGDPPEDSFHETMAEAPSEEAAAAELEVPEPDFPEPEEEEPEEADDPLPMMEDFSLDSFDEFEEEEAEEEVQEEEPLAGLAGLEGLEESEEPDELEQPAASDPLAELRSRVEADPDDGMGWKELGEALMARGEMNEAWEALEQAHQALAARGQVAEAAKVVQGMVAREPDMLGHRQRLVEYAYQLEDDEALTTAFRGLAGLLSRLGEEERAGAVYRQVLLVDPADEEAREALGEDAPPLPTAAPVGEHAQPIPGPEEPARAGVDGGEGEEEYVDLGSLVLDDPSEKTTRWVVSAEAPSGDEEADFARLLGQFKEKVAENLAGEDGTAHYDLGTAYMEMGLVDEAISEFQQALRLDSRNLGAFEMLGRCFLEKGKANMAVRTLQRALQAPHQVEDDLLGIYYFLGTALEKEGNTEEAREFYEKVFSLDINFMDVTERLRGLR